MATIIKNIFVKDINRAIDGVIKADDNTSFITEVEEYVITKEIEKHLNNLLAAYNDYNSATQNGVWISGFFGSGKSHLLKMLAHLFENRTVGGKSVLDMFLPKCDGDELLKAELTKACSIPSKSIHFNIDQKAANVNDQSKLFSTFVKVFNEMCGYCGSVQHIAHFERTLDKDGKFSQFKDTFKSLIGKDWQTARENPILVRKDVDRVMDKVYGEPDGTYNNVLESVRKDYSLSIEDFAKEVCAYIDKQPKGFRLNFFVDEIGQFIADNVQYMLNLQTIAETLATVCNGRAWLFVTSQEDMTNVVGELKKKQGNDFSKILGRFKNGINLTSSNVDEVIRKRLLMKTDESKVELTKIYNAEVNNFKTLFTSSDKSLQYKVFESRDDFVSFYPFIPYQFIVFQNSIKRLSDYNVFMGKHNSVGERSMLGVFQVVAKLLQEKGLGELAPFDYMYEGIRHAIKSNVVRNILNAENEFGKDDFSVRVLKALFLVKYITGFNANKQNLAIILRSRFSEKVQDLQNEIQKALDKLEGLAFVQRTGENYEFLTDKESDIEQEIKNIEVDMTEIRDELNKIFFARIVGSQKVHYEKTKQDYTFGKKIDGQTIGKDAELKIHFLSPYFDRAGVNLSALSWANGELVVDIKEDSKFTSDISLYLRTNKYINQNAGEESIATIIEGKRRVNDERSRDIEKRAEELIANGDFYANGEKLELHSSQKAGLKVHEACQIIIKTTYQNLRMVEGVEFKKDVIISQLVSSQSLGIKTSLIEAEIEVLNKIKFNKQVKKVNTVLSSLFDCFTSKPYGWDEIAVVGCVASLLSRDMIVAQLDGNEIKHKTAADILFNSHKRGNLILTPQIEYNDSEIKRVKNFCKDFCKNPVSAQNPLQMVEELKSEIKEQIETLERYQRFEANYPFLSVLDEPLKRLKEFSMYSTEYIFTKVTNDEFGTLCDARKNVTSSICIFMEGNQRKIFDEAKAFLDKQKENVGYVDAISLKEDYAFIEKNINLPNIYRNPSNVFVTLKDRIASATHGFDTEIANRIDKLLTTIKQTEEVFFTLEEYGKITAEERANFAHKFDEIKEVVKAQTLLGLIKVKEGEFTRLSSQWKLELYNLAQGVNSKGNTQIVKMRKPTVAFAKPIIESEEDLAVFIANYKAAIDALGEELGAQLKDGNKIQWEI